MNDTYAETQCEFQTGAADRTDDKNDGRIMPKKRKIALAACSDPVSEERRTDICRLLDILRGQNLEVEVSRCLFQGDVAGPERKAEELNRFFRDPRMACIFDVSGGELANGVLPFLDYEAIAGSRARLFGYSDLTTVLNAVLAAAGRETVNYQIRNLLYDHGQEQLMYFRERILTDRMDLSELEIRFLRGSYMKGKVFGGNIRCFLKLAGTRWWPDLRGGILLLESLGGGVNQMLTYLQQYSQIGVFGQIQGILLGTFTKMEREQIRPTAEEIVLQLVPEHIPVARTPLIGHGTDAKAIVLGREMEITACAGCRGKT